MAVLSTGSGKGPDLSIRAADGRCHIVPCKELISGQAEPFFIKGWQSKGRPAAVVVLSKPMAVLSKPASLNGRLINHDRFSKVEDKASGRFINQKRPNGPTSRFRPQMAVPCKQFISGQAEPFYQRLAKPVAVLSRPASPNGRFIKADGRFIKRARPMAALSRPMAVLSRCYKGGCGDSGPLKRRV